jgi:hypothetical protein
MSGGTGQIEPEVDLRESWEFLRDQGSRPTCLACATSDAHVHLQKCAPLSVEYLFFQSVQRSTAKDPTSGLTFEQVGDALIHEGQPLEHEWPYAQAQPSSWAPPAITRRWYADLGSRKKDAAEEIARLLRGGHPVVLGLRISAAFIGPALPNATIPGVGSGFGGHAVLAVGLGSDDAGRMHFLIRNSWGVAWGSNGHAWLDSAYFDDKLIGFSHVFALQEKDGSQ